MNIPLAGALCVLCLGALGFKTSTYWRCRNFGKCGLKLYNSETHQCCLDGKIWLLKNRCGQDLFYNPCTQYCCSQSYHLQPSFYVVNKDWKMSEKTACRSLEPIPSHSTLLPLPSVSGDKDSVQLCQRLLICGNRLYDPLILQCCQGETLQPRTLPCGS